MGRITTARYPRRSSRVWLKGYAANYHKFIQILSAISGAEDMVKLLRLWFFLLLSFYCSFYSEYPLDICWYNVRTSYCTVCIIITAVALCLLHFLEHFVTVHSAEQFPQWRRYAKGELKASVVTCQPCIMHHYVSTPFENLHILRIPRLHVQL